MRFHTAIHKTQQALRAYPDLRLNWLKLRYVQQGHGVGLPFDCSVGWR